jgi:TatD related DNase
MLLRWQCLTPTALHLHANAVRPPGLNGCSLKSAENLEVVKALPIDKLLLETDAPWYVSVQNVGEMT